MNINISNVTKFLMILCSLFMSKHLYAASEETNNNRIVLIGASYAGSWNVNQIGRYKVVNKGIGGQESAEILNRFQNEVILEKPKAVIIWGFINDIFRAPKDNVGPAKEKVKANFIKMIDMAKENNILPIVTTELTITTEDTFKEKLMTIIGGLLGKTSYQTKINNHVLEVNKWVREYASANDVAVLDIQPLLSDEDNMRKSEYANKDGSHVTPAAYSELTKYSSKVLPKMLERLE